MKDVANEINSIYDYLQMKTYETAQDILNNSIEFHRYAAAFYQKLREHNSNERARMLLEYMFEQENKTATELDSFRQHASKSILDTWVLITLEVSPKTFFEGLAFHENMSIDDITGLGQEIEAYLVEVFDEMAAIGTTEELRELFQNLVDMETTRKRRLSQAANSLVREM